MSEPLKPCQKCGSINVTVCRYIDHGLDDEHEMARQRWGWCQDCDFEGPHCCSEAEAVASWNRYLRTSDKQLAFGKPWQEIDPAKSAAHWRKLAAAGEVQE